MILTHDAKTALVVQQALKVAAEAYSSYAHNMSCGPQSFKDLHFDEAAKYLNLVDKVEVMPEAP